MKKKIKKKLAIATKTVSILNTKQMNELKGACIPQKTEFFCMPEPW